MTKSSSVGIDLGTTYSCVGVWDEDQVKIIPNDVGNSTTPSVVSFDNFERLIGEEAIELLKINPENAIYDVKRIMGRSYNDEVLQSDMKFWPFHVVKKNNGKPYIRVNYCNEIKDFSPEEISSMILSKLKKNAEAYLDHEVTDAVITVPAYFNDAQRRATKDAGKIAGLRVQRIVNEPTAASIAYGFNKIKLNDTVNILVVDLGGGTFDVSLLSINNGTFEVKATSGDTHLGGEDFDNRLVTYFVNEFKRKYSKDLTTNPKAIRRLKSSCERIKRTLSTRKTANLCIESIHDNIDFHTSITRTRFEEINMDLFKKIIEPMDIVFEDSRISKWDVQEVVLVGGSTRIPKIQSIISEYFDGKKKIKKSINPDEAVAYGAAILSASLSGIKSNKVQDIVLMDVTPISLGVETTGGIMKVIIERNTPIPAKKTKNFTTRYDNQTSITIKVYEGERPLIRDNRYLGEFELTDIPPAPHGVPDIKESISIDENGILNVSAVDTSTGNCKMITIVNDRDRLTKEEIEQIIKDKEKYEEEDRKAKARIESKNDLEKYAFDIRTSLTRNETIKSNIGINNYNKLMEKVNWIIDWIDINPNASQTECERNQYELKILANSILN
ncbi:Hsp70 protein [Neocallimastix californiae]|jgi:L1 cell adhesion molecule like protein|uniref:Hsp70 protein n=1 Tax=Neocallimastix californiae TaxID=1754190 RepID=A0A1Y2D8G1_9FUNG|nr:Hsp70 protein [Neocallimastix californiae]|eukprot:ORY55416.1 Hsp70 protein [Neocallimastix californiae]